MKKLVPLILATTLTSCASNTKEATKTPIVVDKMQAGYIYSTAATSVMLASAIVGYCRDIGAEGYLEAEEVWASKNKRMAQAANNMMEHLAPDPKERNAVISGMEMLAVKTSSDYINNTIKSSANPLTECEKSLNAMKTGAIDIDRQQNVKNVLESYL